MKSGPNRPLRAVALMLLGAALVAVLWIATAAGAAESPPRPAPPASPGAYTPLVAIFVAVVAAAVGLFNVWSNQRFNLRSQKDSQFYEALKRFEEEVVAHFA